MEELKKAKRSASEALEDTSPLTGAKQLLTNLNRLPAHRLALAASSLRRIYFAYLSAEGPVGRGMQKPYPSEVIPHTGN